MEKQLDVATSFSTFGTTMSIHLEIHICLYAHIVCIKLYIYLPMHIDLWHICDVHILPPPPPEMGFSVQKGSWRLGHFSLQIVSICRSIGVFSGIWHFFCVNEVVHEERMRNCVVRRLEFSDSETQLGEFCEESALCGEYKVFLTTS